MDHGCPSRLLQFKKKTFSILFSQYHKVNSECFNSKLLSLKAAVADPSGPARFIHY
jgi:hypothetical protein